MVEGRKAGTGEVAQKHLEEADLAGLEVVLEGDLVRGLVRDLVEDLENGAGFPAKVLALLELEVVDGGSMLEG